MTPKFLCWLWPDRNIGKRESRKLREEHNQLIDSHRELLEATQAALKVFEAWKHDANPHGDLTRGEVADYDAACDMAELMKKAISNATEVK